MIDKLEFMLALAGEKHFGHAAEACGRSADCVARQIWSELDETLEQAMRGITLASIVRRVQDSGGESYVI